MRKLVLASGSPRRRALLAALGIAFEVVASQAEERFEGPPEEMVVRNARAKRNDVARGLGAPALVIGADTLVFLDGQVLGKPRDLEEARGFLARLSGRGHQVFTGLSILDMASGNEAEGFEKTEVVFRPLTPEEIESFIRAVNPLDRAGAYTVDGLGSLLVERYNGCYPNVLGLPIVRLDKLLRQLGLSLFAVLDSTGGGRQAR